MSERRSSGVVWKLKIENFQFSIFNFWLFSTPVTREHMRCARRFHCILLLKNRLFLPFSIENQIDFRIGMRLV